MTDARFRDGDAAAALRLVARDGADLSVLSTLVQDAALTADQIKYIPARRRLALGLNRFRWEDAAAAGQNQRGFERVQSVLVVDEVLGAQSQAIQQGAKTQSLVLLSVAFEPMDAVSGAVVLHFAQGAQLRLNVEALDVTLIDASKPYLAPSGLQPDHET